MNRRISLYIFAAIAAALVIVDRLTKSWAVAALPLGTQDGPNLGIVRLTMVHNEGAAFSIGDGHPMFFVVVAVIILALIVFLILAMKEHMWLDVVALALVAAGAVGNGIDRVLYRYVVDFFDFTFMDFPVFNVADICVVCGVILFIIYVLFFMDFEEEEAVAAARERGGRKQRSGAVQKKLIANRDEHLAKARAGKGKSGKKKVK